MTEKKMLPHCEALGLLKNSQSGPPLSLSELSTSLIDMSLLLTLEVEVRVTLGEAGKGVDRLSLSHGHAGELYRQSIEG